MNNRMLPTKTTKTYRIVANKTSKDKIYGCPLYKKGEVLVAETNEKNAHKYLQHGINIGAGHGVSGWAPPEDLDFFATKHIEYPEEKCFVLGENLFVNSDT